SKNSTRFNSLELITRLILQGILPRNKKFYYFNYKLLKSEIKKQLGVKITARELNLLLSLTLEKITMFLKENLNSKTLSLFDAKNIIEQHQKEIKENFENVIKKKFTQRKINKILDIMLESLSLTLFNNTNLQESLLKTRCDWMEHQYTEIKFKLDNLFKRTLTKEEFHIIIEAWCYYASLVQDFECKDEYLKEQIKELKDSLSISIKLLEKKIQADKQAISTSKSIERFIELDLISYENKLIQDIEQLEHLKSLKLKIQQNNGSELNLNKIKEKAYFSLFFIGELLGLSEPSFRKLGNPLLSLLEILQNWSKLDANATRKRISNIYGKYKKFKKSNNLEILLAQKNNAPHSILEKFKFSISSLSINPAIQLNTQDS
ncbi:TPA: hypothetical protein ACT9JI_003359, partial [Legionella pneumophila]